MQAGRTVLLYCPPPRLDRPSTRAPLALLAISSTIAEDFDIVVLPRDPKEHETIFAKYADDTLCFGVSVMTGPQILAGLESSKLFKEVCLDASVVWGGWHPTIFPEQVASHPLIDIVVRGQGEETFAKLVQTLSSRSAYDTVAGLTFKRDGKVAQTPPVPFKDINSFPSFPYSILEMNDYVFADELGERTINYVSSRGCPYHCSYCAQNMISGGRWYGFTAERVMTDIRLLKEKYLVDGVLFDDANFFVDKVRVEQLAEKLIESRVTVNWGMATGRIEDLKVYPSDLWSRLRESGLRSVFVGLEPQCGAIVREGADAYQELDKDVLHLAKLTGRYDIKLKLSLLVGFPPNGLDALPFDEELEQAKKLLESCYNISKAVEGTISPYLPFPHAPLFERAVRAGLKPPETLEAWGRWVPESQEVPWIRKGYLKVLEEVNDFFRWR